MGLVYHDDEGSVGGVSNKVGLAMRIDRMNPNKPYARHLGNWYYLKFLYTNGTILEKRQAQMELVICERKLAFWYKHPCFSIEEAGKAIKELQAQWNITEQPKK